MLMREVLRGIYIRLPEYLQTADIMIKPLGKSSGCLHSVRAAGVHCVGRKRSILQEELHMVRTFAAIDVGSFELELGIYEITDKGTVRSVDQV